MLIVGLCWSALHPTSPAERTKADNSFFIEQLPFIQSRRAPLQLSNFPFEYEHLHVRFVVIPVPNYAQLAIKNVVLLGFGLALINQRLPHFSVPRSADIVGT